MKPNKCSLCNQLTHTPIHFTDIEKDGSVNSFHMCQKCGSPYMEEANGKIEQTPEETNMHQQQTIDLSNIKTPEELLHFLTGLKVKPAPNPDSKPCSCGMSEEEFDNTGRFGCQHCYKHFPEKMEEWVFPFHKAKAHTGKKPKRNYIESLMQNPVEKEKILKLRYAKALELEAYEQAAVIKKELENLKNEQQP
jgi:protein arginine kinase activator